MSSETQEAPVVEVPRTFPWRGVNPKFEANIGRGRPKGSENKVKREVREAARNIIDDPEYREKLKARVMAGTAPHMETLLWHYAYGKPKETVEITTVPAAYENMTAEQLADRAKQVGELLLMIESERKSRMLESVADAEIVNQSTPDSASAQT